jgi:hypothetical protein
MKLIELFGDLPQNLRALDFYAGEAKWITPQLKGFSDVTLWEVNPAFEATLRERMPNARVQIGDSYAMARLPENRGRFDLILMDNHVGAFGVHVEHFDALNHVPTLLSEGGGYLVLNICTSPLGLLTWNYVRNYRALWANTKATLRKYLDDTYDRWLKGRVAFYGKVDVDKEEAEETYTRFFNAYNLHISEFRWARRRPFLYLLRMRL